MIGKLRLNDLGGWEIVDISGNRKLVTLGCKFEVHIWGVWHEVKTVRQEPIGRHYFVRGQRIHLSEGLEAKVTDY
jgi:hypothetical protein